VEEEALAGQEGARESSPKGANVRHFVSAIFVVSVVLLTCECRNTTEGVRQDVEEARDSVCHEAATLELLEISEHLIDELNNTALKPGGLKSGFSPEDPRLKPEQYTWLYQASIPQIDLYRLRHAAALVRAKRNLPLRKEDKILLQFWDTDQRAPFLP
jgi:predicted small secreted protein